VRYLNRTYRLLPTQGAISLLKTEICAMNFTLAGSCLTPRLPGRKKSGG
jgi:hypothetical protein